jgi:hypothetical protein
MPIKGRVNVWYWIMNRVMKKVFFTINCVSVPSYFNFTI